MTRTGKIARLPRHLREQLNRRLDDGEPALPLLAWLNECPEVREMLARDFSGRAVSEQNLSEWRQGGFRDWQRQQEACGHVRRLTDQAEALNEAAEETRVSDRLASVFAVKLFELLERLLESGDDREKMGHLREGLREIRLLRRGDHQAARLRMELERWERQREDEDEAKIERIKEKSRSRLIDMVFSKSTEDTLAGVFGGGESGRKMAAMITRIKFDLPVDDPPSSGETPPPADWSREASGPRERQSNQGGSH